ncbi:uncharacterized protein [Acropora muricata]|uniref:uncharacterized protein n=1 Tax=Acropora muricata TaxID=159855 RepID=UPI0034E40D0A
MVFLKLSKDSVCFSSLTLAMVAVITQVLITKIEVTTGQPQKTMYFTRFQDFHLSAGQIIDTFSSTDEFDCGLRCLRNQHCRSYNSKDTGDDIHGKTICQLSNQTRRTAPDFFKPTSGFTYFEKAQVVKGQYSGHPGHSCKDILESKDSVGDGEYWIDPGRNCKSLKVYCDMTTAGGGWLLIFNVVVDNNSSLPPITTQDDYRKIGDFQSKALILTNNALFELQKHLAFEQLRFHCYKPGVRTFHVATIANSTGEWVIRYLTEQTEELPKASGSFTRLPGDNSLLTLRPADWGYEKDTYKVGKWSHQGKKALWDHLVFIQDHAHWLLESSRWECDDFTSSSSPPTGSFWKIYVR